MTDTPPIWTEPLELVCDGTPLVFDDPFDDPDEPCEGYGNYALAREDGLPFTAKQHPAYLRAPIMFVTTYGKYWERCGPNDPVLVRNRAQMDAAESDESLGPVIARLLERVDVEAWVKVRDEIDAMMAERDKGGEA